MNLRLVGKIRREDGVWYAGYSQTGQLVEFLPMPDASPVIIGKLNNAIPTRSGDVDLDVNDVKAFRAVKG